MTNAFWPTAQPDSLGPMIGAGDVRDAVKATVLEWAPWYLGVISERLATAGLIGGPDQNPNPLPNFDTFVNEPEFRSFGTGQPAAFLVTVPATVGKPALQGSGGYIAVFRCQVHVCVFGTTWEEAADLLNWYKGAVYWSLLQHHSLGGFAMSTAWAGENNSGEQHTSTRTLGDSTLGFDIQVANVLNVLRGPVSVPDTPGPPPPDPTVDEAVLVLNNDTLVL